jgi:predicted CoA-binding protein
MISNQAVRTFLDGHRIAVVGASDRKDSFGRAICRALIDHGYDAVPVHPDEGEVEGRPCYGSLSAVPEALDGVIVMVPPEVAVGVVEEAATLGLDQVWLFKGVGGKGSVSAVVLDACQAHGISPVAGACPLMFLEPVTSVHRIHRAVRRLKGDVERAGS